MPWVGPPRRIKRTMETYLKQCCLQIRIQFDHEPLCNIYEVLQGSCLVPLLILMDITFLSLAKLQFIDDILCSPIVSAKIQVLASCKVGGTLLYGCQVESFSFSDVRFSSFMSSKPQN